MNITKEKLEPTQAMLRETVKEVTSVGPPVGGKIAGGLLGLASSVLSSVLGSDRRSVPRRGMPGLSAAEQAKLIEGIRGLDKSPHGAEMLQKAVGMAIKLREAGAFDGNLAVVIDARKGAYDYAAVVGAIKGFINAESPIRYFVIVDKAPTEKLPGNINIVEVSDDKQGDNSVIASVTAKIAEVAGKEKVKIDNKNVIYALTENKVAIAADHYRKLKNTDKALSFLVANNKAVAGEHDKVPAAALIVKLTTMAISKNEAVAVTVGCAERTIAMLEGILKGAIRLIRIAKLQINEMMNNFMAAFGATSKSA